jgi:caa(3)-type oxidase subunit IV
MAIWATLLVFLFVSIGLSHVPNVYLMNGIVFTIAFVKAFLVMRYFMHLKMEPWLITILMIGAVLTLVVLLIGVSPDVTFHAGVGKRPL